MKHKKSMDKPRPVLVIAAFCVGVSFLMLVISSAIITTLVLKDKIKIESIDYISKIVLSVVVFLGVKLIKILKSDASVPAALIYSGAMLIAQFGMGIILRDRIGDVLLNTMFVICGAGLGLLLSNKNKRKVTMKKKRYR